MTVRYVGICLILLLFWTKSEFVPFVPILTSPCARFTHSFPNTVVQTSPVAEYFANFLLSVIDSPVIGCITGTNKFLNGVVVFCNGIDI